MKRALLIALALTACQRAHSPTMDPGVDCLSCHDGLQARAWTIAGTLFDNPTPPAKAVDGAEVLVTDADHRELTLRTNSAGNFYTAEPLRFPVTVEVQKDGKRFGMNDTPQIGNCNYCHVKPGPEDALGHIFLPR